MSKTQMQKYWENNLVDSTVEGQKTPPPHYRALTDCFKLKSETLAVVSLGIFNSSISQYIQSRSGSQLFPHSGTKRIQAVSQLESLKHATNANTTKTPPTIPLQFSSLANKTIRSKETNIDLFCLYTTNSTGLWLEIFDLITGDDQHPGKYKFLTL